LQCIARAGSKFLNKVGFPLKIKIRQLVSDWLPVIAWMSLMFAGSSDLMSAEHTSRFLAPILRWLKPDISVATLDAV